MNTEPLGRPDSPSGLPVGDLPVDGSPSIDMPTPSSALAIGAHPDDIEFGCGGTLAKWVSNGCRVHYLILTDGSKGSWDPMRKLDELIAERQEECIAAAGVILGVEGAGESSDGEGIEQHVTFLDLIDGELTTGMTERQAVCRVIRTVRPSVVLGHDPWRRYRLHPDHRSAGFLTVDAVVAARDPHFFPELALAPHRPDELLLWEPDQLNHIEDVRGFEALKIQALLCHRSQQQTTMGIDGEGEGEQRQSEIDDFGRRVRHQLRAHGVPASLEAGEAFHRMTEL